MSYLDHLKRITVNDALQGDTFRHRSVNMKKNPNILHILSEDLVWDTFLFLFRKAV